MGSVVACVCVCTMNSGREGSSSDGYFVRVRIVSRQQVRVNGLDLRVLLYCATEVVVDVGASLFT